MTSQEAAGDDNIEPDKRIANKIVNENGGNRYTLASEKRSNQKKSLMK